MIDIISNQYSVTFRYTSSKKRAHQDLIAYPFSAGMNITTPVTLLGHIHPLIKKGCPFKTPPKYLL